MCKIIRKNLLKAIILTAHNLWINIDPSDLRKGRHRFIKLESTYRTLFKIMNTNFRISI